MNNKKIILGFILLILTIFTGSCKKDEPIQDHKPDDHIHDYTSTVYAPTCTEKGYTEYICDCGNSYKDNYVEAVGHKESIDEAIAATCELKGKKEGKHCSVCNKVLVAQEDIAALGHNEVYTYYSDYHYSYCDICEKYLPEENHILSNGTCECGYSVDMSDGLVYELLEDDTYMIASIGTFTGAELIIPKYYNGKPVTIIYDDVFFENENIKTVTIPNTITAINEFAFAKCRNLENVYFENESKLEIIGDSAFENCTSLKELLIPTKVTTIGDSAFGSCQSLENIGILSGVKTIGDGSFVQCNALTNITIPASVESIGVAAFYQCQALTNVVFEEGSKLTNLANNIFYGCESLTSINIPASVETISDYAFYQCKSLTTVDIDEASELKNINEAAFYYCVSLYKLVLPNKMEAIGDLAFDSCYKLYEIYNLSSLDVTIGYDVGYVGAHALFIHTSLAEESCILYDENGFVFIKEDDDYYLVGSTLKDSDIVLPKNFKGEEYDIYFRAFLESDYSSIVIPEGVTTICEYAFTGSKKLESITLPSTLLQIDYDAFYRCFKLFDIYNLSTLDIECGSDDNGSVGMYAKNIYTSLYKTTQKLVDENGFSFKVDENNNYYLCGYDKNKTEIVLPDDINGNKYHLNNGVFFESNIESIVISSGIISIDNYAFYGCENLCNVIISDGLTSIGKYAFALCYDITSLSIPQSVKSIGEYAFYYCQIMKTINLSNGLESIGIKAFVSCSSLESITIPDSVKSIGEYAFYNCKSLASVKLSNNLSKLDDSLFVGCNELVSIIIPSSVLIIETNLLSGCGKLENVYYFGSKEQWNLVEKSEYNIDILLNPSFYSESEPTDSGNYWHYDTDGITPIKWENK